MRVPAEILPPSVTVPAVPAKMASLASDQLTAVAPSSQPEAPTVQVPVPPAEVALAVTVAPSQ